MPKFKLELDLQCKYSRKIAVAIQTRRNQRRALAKKLAK
jgi:hypothetical protein